MTVFQSISSGLPENGRREMIDDRQKSKHPLLTYCKYCRPLPYQALKDTQHHPPTTTPPPPPPPPPHTLFYYIENIEYLYTQSYLKQRYLIFIAKHVIGQFFCHKNARLCYCQNTSVLANDKSLLLALYLIAGYSIEPTITLIFS